MTYWEKINKDLTGQNGFVYLMFLGRKTAGEDVATELANVEHKILERPEDQVYAAIRFLEKKGYLHFIRKEGRRKIRTAKLDPMIETCQQYDLPFNEGVIRAIGKSMGDFSKHVSRILHARVTKIRGKEWSFLFEKYTHFVENLTTLAFLECFRSSEFPSFEPHEFLNWTLQAYAKNLRLPRKSRALVNQAHKLLRETFEKITPEDQHTLAKYAQSLVWPWMESLNMNAKDKKEISRILDEWIS